MSILWPDSAPDMICSAGMTVEPALSRTYADNIVRQVFRAWIAEFSCFGCYGRVRFR